MIIFNGKRLDTFPQRLGRSQGHLLLSLLLNILVSVRARKRNKRHSIGKKENYKQYGCLHRKAHRIYKDMIRSSKIIWQEYKMQVLGEGCCMFS